MVRWSLVIAGVGAIVLTGCDGGSKHHDPVASPVAGGRPLPTTAPRGDGDTGECANVSYRLTSAGAVVTAKVAAPANVTFEADDRDDNPITGDPGTSGVNHRFTGRETTTTLTIKGVRGFDHLSVIALDTGQDDSCRAYPHS